MDFWIVENGEYVKYRRTGACKKCGKCCCKNIIGAQVSLARRQPEGEKEEKIDEPLSKAEGWSAFRAQGLWFWIKFDVKDKIREKECGGFVDGECSIWKGYDFPAICRYWPVHPNDLVKFPDCGFSFERVGSLLP